MPIDIYKELGESFRALGDRQEYFVSELLVFRYKLAAKLRRQFDAPLGQILEKVGYMPPLQAMNCCCMSKVNGDWRRYRDDPEVVLLDGGNAKAMRNCWLCGGRGWVHEPIDDGQCTCTGAHHQLSAEAVREILARGCV